MPHCPHCDKEVAWDARFCPNCGKRKPAEESYSSSGEPFGLWDVILFGCGGGVLGWIIALFLMYGTTVGDAIGILIYGTKQGAGDAIFHWCITLGALGGAGFAVYEISQSGDMKRLLKQALWAVIVFAVLVFMGMLLSIRR